MFVLYSRYHLRRRRRRRPLLSKFESVDSLVLFRSFHSVVPSLSAIPARHTCNRRPVSDGPSDVAKRSSGGYGLFCYYGFFFSAIIASRHVGHAIRQQRRRRPNARDDATPTAEVETVNALTYRKRRRVCGAHRVLRTGVSQSVIPEIPPESVRPWRESTNSSLNTETVDVIHVVIRSSVRVALRRNHHKA